MCRAAPWEAVFYKQTDRDLYRKRWSKTAGLYTCTGQKRLKKKQLCLVRGTLATAVLAMMRPPLHPGSHPLCQLPNLTQIISLLKPADFFEMTCTASQNVAAEMWHYSLHPDPVPAFEEIHSESGKCV